ncbi:hypothetical protein L198_01715 [Cryptococcus wingfieldii CBS 7118]|uniref:Uncharacterized protein n=1 Tax=Cryptococcus wingfieldii CBS 7118 TaxID=1295528 RepID=A0A1E3K0E2_9TREE|nr:hypothetical protein L198_01715 [Cryptococcus wingfieldii CBS 7118]ODO06483.1 hypothetical protein L198_01715 [Cryptococcus wingfieldii CBS 7118]
MFFRAYDGTINHALQGLDQLALPTDQREWEEGIIELQPSATYENQPDVQEYLKLLGSDMAQDRDDQIDEGRKKLLDASQKGFGHFWAQLLSDPCIRAKIGHDVLDRTYTEHSEKYRWDSVLTIVSEGRG